LIGCINKSTHMQGDSPDVQRVPFIPNSAGLWL
jgi:hypothetical protein